MKAQGGVRPFLDIHAAEDISITLDRLVFYTEEVIHQHLEDSDFITVEASTAGELVDRLQPYTYVSRGEDGEGFSSPWPLVDRIDIGLDHPLLNEGIILLDAAGSSDPNRIRRMNAIKHQQQCRYRLTVAAVKRLEDGGETLLESLVKGYQNRGSGNTILVVTGCDEVDEDSPAEGKKSERTKAASLKSKIRELQQSQDEWKGRLRRLPKSARRPVMKEVAQGKAAIMRTKRELKILRLNMRNRTALEPLQEQYTNLTGDGKPLAAFMTGNKCYRRHLDGYAPSKKPLQTVEQTNIPALRKHLFCLPSDGKLNEELHLATNQLPSLLNDFEMYCSRNPSC